MLKRGDGGPIKPEVAPLRRGQRTHVKTEIREIEPGAHYELDVTLGPPWPSGRFTDVLQLTTGVPEAPTMNYYVMATVPPRLSTRPGYIMVPVNRNEEITRKARIHWEDNKPAKVTEINSSIPGAKVEIEDDIHGQLVSLTVPPGTDRPRGRQFVTITIDEGDSSVIQVPVVFRDDRLRAAQRRQITPARREANLKAQRNREANLKAQRNREANLKAQRNREANLKAQKKAKRSGADATDGK